MEISQLEAFVAVVEEKSFSRAAARLHRTQPAVSQAVKRLEEWAREPLLDRSAKSGVLTEAGRILYDHAKKVLNLRVEARFAMEELRALDRGRVTIGANESTALYLLPVLKKFRERYPRINVAVKRSLSREIPIALLRYEIDLGVLSYDPQNADLESTVVSLDELCLIVPPAHPLAKAREASIHELGKESFIAHNVASPYRQRVIETFARFRTPLNIALELPTVETIKKSVRLGMGLAFAPRMCLEDELARGECVAVRVKEMRIQRKLRLIYRRHAALSAAAQAFLLTAREMGIVQGSGARN
jgi:DNA-binding transcriptional LysR family regulator